MTKSVLKKTSKVAKKHSLAFRYLNDLVASEMKVFYAAYNMPTKSAKKDAAKKVVRKATRI